MLAHRATILAAGAASLCWRRAAGAQMDQNTAVNILRECARIDDASARLACYDNNIRNVGGTRARPMSRPDAGRAGRRRRARSRANSPQRLRRRGRAHARALLGDRPASCRRSTRGSRRSAARAGHLCLHARGRRRVAVRRKREPDYRVPRAGSTVEIERGALGSFLMRFDDQNPVPVRRVR
jgi:hypothetical protein